MCKEMYNTPVVIVKRSSSTPIEMAKIWMRIYRKDPSYIDGPTVNWSYSDKQFDKKKNIAK